MSLSPTYHLIRLLGGWVGRWVNSLTYPPFYAGAQGGMVFLSPAFPHKHPMMQVGLREREKDWPQVIQ